MREPVWIDERDTLALHDRLLALDGGAAGVRNRGLLQSALARPQQLHAYGDDPDTVDMDVRRGDLSGAATALLKCCSRPI